MKTFESFSEGLLGNLKGRIRSIFFKSENTSKLSKFRISSKKIADSHYQFIHDNRIIAELKVDGEEMNMPVFRLFLYYYESEIPNKNSLRINKKLDGQKEQPYAKGSKKFLNTDNAIDFLISFWSSKTNSGKSKNSNYKIKI